MILLFPISIETSPELDDLRPKTSRSVVAQLVVFDKQDHRDLIVQIDRYDTIPMKYFNVWAKQSLKILCWSKLSFLSISST